MKSPNIYNLKETKGFTLIEILVVMTLLAFFAGLGLVFSFDSYRGHLFRAEYTNVIHILSIARNKSINNFNESAHGVHIDADNYTLFIGDDYVASDPDFHRTFPKSKAFSIGGVDDIVFEQLSGAVDIGNTNCDTSPCVLEFNSGLLYRSITINDAGGIINDN